MSSSVFGNIFKIMTYGESHGKALGVVIDGCPAGLPLTEEDIQKYLDLRKPGQSEFTTTRSEGDLVEILSGVFEGKTTGTPISLVVKNTSQRSSDYSEIASYYRPGHADFTFDAKYGFRDYRGGGRSSGRETIGRVAAGAIAIKILETFGISFTTFTRQIGNISIGENADIYNKDKINSDKLRMPDENASLKAQEYLNNLRNECDSSGGIIECRINGIKAGLGNPCFDKLDAKLAYAAMSVGAVKGVEFGVGFDVAEMTGSENNDEFILTNDADKNNFDITKHITKKTNNSGGVLGGMSDGSEIIFRCAVKPTPSIAKTQHTVNKAGEEIEISIKGRHDPVVVPRAVVVIEAMAALTVLDALLENQSSKLEDIRY